uniref:Uncharacterized protein n=1 Tax=Anguilla anguilla TaxID=7936 RepID=A0A0E9TBA5_ANGAN
MPQCTKGCSEEERKEKKKFSGN